MHHSVVHDTYSVEEAERPLRAAEANRQFHTTEYYSALKKEETPTRTVPCMRSSSAETDGKTGATQTMEYYSTSKRRELSNNKQTWRRRKCPPRSERSHTRWDSNQTTFWARQNYGGPGEAKGCRGLGERGVDTWGTEGVWAVTAVRRRL